MGRLERLTRSVDGFQQRHSVSAFGFGVIKKYGDDRGGSLAALITFYGFLSLFPLLLLVFTLVGIAVGPHSSAERAVVNSAVSQFPVVGHELADNIHVLSRGSPFALAVGLIGLLWGSLGVIHAGQHAMDQIWNVPGVSRPGFWVRLARGLVLLGVVGVFLLVSSVLAGASTIGASIFGGDSAAVRVGTWLAAVVVNVAVYLVAFRILTRRDIRLRQLLPGSVLGGVLWSALQAFGGYLVGHQLRHSSQIYGFFAIVLGLILWLNLGAQLALYSAEVNVVRLRRLWPRSLVQPPLTRADRKVLVALAEQEERRPEQDVTVRFAPDPEKRE